MTVRVHRLRQINGPFGASEGQFIDNPADTPPALLAEPYDVTDPDIYRLYLAACPKEKSAKNSMGRWG